MTLPSSDMTELSEVALDDSELLDDETALGASAGGRTPKNSLATTGALLLPQRPPSLQIDSNTSEKPTNQTTPLVRAMARVGLKDAEGARRSGSMTERSASPGSESTQCDEQLGVSDAGIWSETRSSVGELSPAPLLDQPMSPNSEEQAMDDLRCVTVWPCVGPGPSLRP